MFLKSVIHFIFVCFHAILNSAKTNMVIITIKIARLSSWNQYIVNMSNINLSLYPQIQSNQNIKHSSFIENLPNSTSINYSWLFLCIRPYMNHTFNYMCHIYDVNMILCTKRASYKWAGIVIFSIEQHLLQLFCCLQFYRNF